MSEEYISPYVRDAKKPNPRRTTVSNYGLVCGNKYLFLYNLTLFLLFSKVFLTILSKIWTGHITDDEIEKVAHIIKILTYTQLMESIHPLVGLVPGGSFMPFLQVIGRLFVNYLLTEPEIRLNSAPFAHYLFLVWSTIEIFRYSYYALRVMNIDQYLITWCRYSLFMPLYPLGGFCESMIIISTINYYNKIKKFQIDLPNAANISFSVPTMLKIYIILLLWPSIITLMKYMSRQRSKQLTKVKKA